MLGPSYYVMGAVVSHAGLISGNAFFILFETPFYWNEFSPAIGIVQAALFVASWVMLVLTQCSDPGVLTSKHFGLGVGGKEDEKPPNPGLMQDGGEKKALGKASIYT